ncbi:MAG: methylated-DNA--[protein]-cysteine S-methyltransferase [Dehalococcoidales bacterium]
MKNSNATDLIYTCEIETPLGTATASATENGLTGLWFNKQKYYPQSANIWSNKPELPIFKDLTAWLSDYFKGANPSLTFQLAPKGTSFQEAVWKILLEIPYGELTTYSAIAKQIAKERNLASMSAQAVGGAVGHNPISIIIPCHRVIGSDRTLTGYAGGLDKKVFLLRLEKVDLAGIE